MSTPYIGEIRLLPFPAGAPTGWFRCDGSLLQISQFTALFSLLGTAYGGNGQTTFGLPDLRGRVPIHQGNGAGLSSHVLGDIGGTETVALTTPQMGAHTHVPIASTATATSDTPTGRVLAAVGGNASGDRFYAPSGIGALSPTGEALQPAGSSVPHDNTAPTLVLQYCIAWQGVFPSRN